MEKVLNRGEHRRISWGNESSRWVTDWQEMRGSALLYIFPIFNHHPYSAYCIYSLNCYVLYAEGGKRRKMAEAGDTFLPCGHTANHNQS